MPSSVFVLALNLFILDDNLLFGFTEIGEFYGTESLSLKPSRVVFSG